MMKLLLLLVVTIARVARGSLDATEQATSSAVISTESSSSSTSSGINGATTSTLTTTTSGSKNNDSSPNNTVSAVIGNTSIRPSLRPTFAGKFVVKSAPSEAEGLNADTNKTAPTGKNAANEPGATTPSILWVIESKWSYDDLSNWGNASGVCSVGEKQSPVQLSLEDAVTNSYLVADPLVFNNYNKVVSGKLTNTGRFAVFQINFNATNVVPTISGSNYGKETAYTLDRVTFHWGADNVESGCKGSEHVVDYHPGPMEVHFVHRNSKYETFEDAELKQDGLAIVGFLFKAIGNGTSVALNAATNYAPIVSNLGEISMPNTSVVMSLDMTDLLPPFALSSSSVYFRYQGSLTAPPCFETVSWSVFLERIPIPVHYLRAFQSKLMAKSLAGSAKPYHVLENNYRPIQMRNDRIIWTNGKGFGVVGSLAPRICFDLISLAAVLVVVAIFSR